MSKYLYIKFRANWADEMNVFGFAVMLKSEWHKENDYAREYFNEIPSFEISVGSNQEIEFKGYDEWVSCFEAKEISDITASELISINNGSSNSCSFGKFPTVSEYGQDLDYFRENKAKEEAAKKIQDAKTPEQIEEEECQEYLEDLKKKPVADEGYGRYSIRTRMSYIQAVIKRTPCQEDVLKEYYRILDIPTT
jgi:hypothetical protein